MQTSSSHLALDELPRVVVRPRRALPFFSRHPWVFSGAIQKIDGSPEPGAEVALVSHENQFIARGLFNPQSNIKVRLYCWEAETPLDEPAFWSRRLDEAIALRRKLYPALGGESAVRWVYSEADGLSGLIVDQYGDWLLVQFTSFALARRQEMLIELLKEKLNPQGIWLRTEKGIREAEGLDLADGLIDGTEPPRPIFVEEHGVRYGVDVVEGQKTGFFLDQRENRRTLAQHVRGQRVLDVFCYSGGFALSALIQGGAREAVGLDVSKAAIVLAQSNAELNDVGDRVRFEKADAFKEMERLHQAGERFDTVVLDPPKLARNRKGVPNALRGYFSLNRLAVDLLEPGGLLLTCSCSGHVSRDQFEEMLATVSLKSERSIQILEARGQAYDHPTSVHCRETEYLKCYLCRVI